MDVSWGSVRLRVAWFLANFWHARPLPTTSGGSAGQLARAWTPGCATRERRGTGRPSSPRPLWRRTAGASRPGEPSRGRLGDRPAATAPMARSDPGTHPEGPWAAASHGGARVRSRAVVRPAHRLRPDDAGVVSRRLG